MESLWAGVRAQFLTTKPYLIKEHSPVVPKAFLEDTSEVLLSPRDVSGLFLFSVFIDIISVHIYEVQYNNDACTVCKDQN